MHELSIVAGLFETIETLARDHDAAAVTGVWIKVGPLSGVVPELLESAFDAYKKGTIAAGASLNIEKTLFRIRCRECGLETARDEAQFLCPACASTDLELLQGMELVLERIEMEGNEPPPDRKP